MRTAARALTLAVSAVCLVACQDGGPSQPAPRFAISTSTWAPGDPSAQAALAGELAVEGDCMLVRGTGPRIADQEPIWPSGWYATVVMAAGKRTVEVRRGDGSIAAVSGRVLQASGAAGPAGAGRCGMPTFLIQTELR